MKSVAILFPVYNPNVDWLRNSIASLLNQRDVNIHVFVGYDGYIPTFTISNILKDIKHTTYGFNHSGLTKTLNKLIVKVLSSQYKFDYIMRLDCDDLYIKDKCISQINYMEDNKLDISGTYGNSIDDKGHIITNKMSYGMYANNIRITTENVADILKNVGNCLIHSSICVNSKLFYSGNFFYNSTLKYAQDYELWLRLLQSNFKLGVVPKILVKYRTSDTQITSKNKNEIYSIVRKIRSFYG